MRRWDAGGVKAGKEVTMLQDVAGKVFAMWLVSVGSGALPD